MTALQTLPAGRYRDTARQAAKEHLRAWTDYWLQMERPEFYRRTAVRTAEHVHGVWASIEPERLGTSVHVYLDLYAASVGAQLAAMVLARRARRAA